MPTFKGVTVEIHCPKESPTDIESFNWGQVQHGAVSEHGTHKLRHTPKITSYIPAVTNCPFAVSITILDSYEPKVKGDDRESLAAYVYFDGKPKEETATLLRRGVETWISSRWIEVTDGQLAEREFVFREVGLENFFNTLDISREMKEIQKANRRHSMPVSMDRGDDDLEIAPKPKESAGQIRVDLFRVRCEGPVRRGVWGDMFKDNLTNGSSESDVGGNVDVSHTAGYIFVLTAINPSTMLMNNVIAFLIPNLLTRRLSLPSPSVTSIPMELFSPVSFSSTVPSTN
jgi:hypothetical protein